MTQRLVRGVCNGESVRMLSLNIHVFLSHGQQMLKSDIAEDYTRIISVLCSQLFLIIIDDEIQLHRAR